MAKKLSKKEVAAFPKTMFIRREDDDNDGPYFIADEDGSAAEDGDAVAIYELREVRRKRVAHSLE